MSEFVGLKQFTPRGLAQNAVWLGKFQAMNSAVSVAEYTEIVNEIKQHLIDNGTLGTLTAARIVEIGMQKGFDAYTTERAADDFCNQFGKGD